MCESRCVPDIITINLYNNNNEFIGLRSMKMCEFIIKYYDLKEILNNIFRLDRKRRVSIKSYKKDPCLSNDKDCCIIRKFRDHDVFQMQKISVFDCVLVEEL
jgi:hypothetical protein